MIAKKTYENMDFLRGGHPYDILKIGKEELRILDKLRPIAKELGLEDIGIEDLNKKKAIASWRLPSLRGYKGGRITFFRDTDKPEREYDYGIFIMGKHGTNIEDWRKWDTLEKWKQNIGFMYESVSFERGKEPKKTIGVGLDCKRYVKSQLEKKGFGNPVDEERFWDLFGAGFEDMSADEMAAHVIYILDAGDIESMINYMNMELDNFYQFKEETDEDE